MREGQNPEGPLVPDEVLQPNHIDTSSPDDAPSEGTTARGGPLDEPDTTTRAPRGRPPSDWKERFLVTLSKLANVRAACEIAQVSRETAYHHRGNDEAFAAAWATALEDAYDRLEQAAWERAVVGVERVTYGADGKVRSREVVYSDRMTELLLKAGRPEKFVDRLRVQKDDESELDAEILSLARELNIRAERAELGEGQQEEEAEGEREESEVDG